MASALTLYDGLMDVVATLLKAPSKDCTHSTKVILVNRRNSINYSQTAVQIWKEATTIADTL